MQMSRLLIVLCCVALVDCNEKAPPAPPVLAPADPERIGWDQPAADAAELAKLAYVMYIDGTRTVLDSVSCVPSPTTSSPVVTFTCAAGLPTLTPGAHILEIATVDKDGTRESARSAPLRVTIAGAAAPAPNEGKR